MSRRFAFLAALLVLPMAAPALAGSEGPVLWQIELGYSMVQGMPGDVFEDGYLLGFGAVIQPNPKSPIGYRFDFTYDFWDVNTGALDIDDSTPGAEVDIDDGDGDQFRLSAGVQYESQGDRAKFVGGVGIGAYRLHADLTNSVLVPGYICDPYWWWYCYPGLVEGDVILTNKTLTKFGYYASLGVVFPLTNSDFFIEAEYHWVNVEDYFETLPIVFGWRF
jgi:hypothetical protein